MLCASVGRAVFIAGLSGARSQLETAEYATAVCGGQGQARTQGQGGGADSSCTARAINPRLNPLGFSAYSQRAMIWRAMQHDGCPDSSCVWSGSQKRQGFAHGIPSGTHEATRSHYYHWSCCWSHPGSHLLKDFNICRRKTGSLALLQADCSLQPLQASCWCQAHLSSLLSGQTIASGFREICMTPTLQGELQLTSFQGAGWRPSLLVSRSLPKSSLALRFSRFQALQTRSRRSKLAYWSSADMHGTTAGCFR